MRLVKIARSYLKQAEARLSDAKDAYQEDNYPYAVRLSQECVELSLKAVLKAVGIEYPKVHDVSDVLLSVGQRFPEWFQQELTYLSESSKILVKKREVSFYGGEEAFLSPDEVIGEEDARDAIGRAGKAFTICRKLVEELED
ncbi:MAG: HEPN domain-containing protein [Candidatus Brockarchaeota archaeon]|nr:HEPN domain-containing protein [Candidatus Brockarchaeota archaeon]MBO3809546.1 HEPN domain-containing protein [Candidatus Brockarchaeota archaeon]